MKKKILSSALAGVLACSLSGSALAAGFYGHKSPLGSLPDFPLERPRYHFRL